MKKSLILLISAFLLSGFLTLQAKVTLKIFQFKVEIVEQLDELKEDFEKANPDIEVVIDTAGGGEDYGALLRSRMNSGNLPAIYNIPGPTALLEYKDFVYDLSNQPWVKEAIKGTLDGASTGGKVYGQPYNIEGYGLMYNSEILKKAGYSESDLFNMKSFEKLEKLFADLEKQKKKLGIEYVLSYSVGSSAWWVAAYHTFNVPFAMQNDPAKFQKELSSGKASIPDNKIFQGFTKTLDLFFKYSYPNLINVSYDDQVANFALGKTAFLQQGNWTINQLLELEPNLKAGFMPIMIPGAGGKNANIPIGVPNYFAVNKKSSKAEIDAALKFLNYIAMDERGHKFLVEDVKFIPAFKNVPSDASDSLAKSILKYAGKDRILPWVWHSFPKGYNETDAKEAIQKYYSKKFTAKQYLEYLDKKWKEKAK